MHRLSSQQEKPFISFLQFTVGTFCFLLLTVCLQLPSCRSFQSFIPHHRPRHLACHDRETRHPYRQWNCLRALSSDSLHESSPDFETLLRKVAADDPDWFQEFVVKTLGEDAVDMKEVGLEGGRGKDEEEEEPAVAIAAEAVPVIETVMNANVTATGESATMSASTIAAVADHEEDVAEGIRFDSESKERVLGSNEPSQDEDFVTDVVNEAEAARPLDDFVKEVDYPAVIENSPAGATHVTKKVKGQETVSTEEPDDLIDTTKNPSVSEKVSNPDGNTADDEGARLAMRTLIDEVFKETLSAIRQEEVKPQRDTDKPLAETNIASLPRSTERRVQTSRDTRSVIFQPAFRRRPMYVPITLFYDLGYTEEEVRMLSIDAMEMILEENKAKPKYGLPSGWKSPSPVVEIREAVQSDSFQKTETTVKSPQETVGAREVRASTVDAVSEARKPDDRLNMTIDEERVALFCDPSGEYWASASLSTLTKLGYTIDDIESLDPGALNLILVEGLPRPRKGIPRKWRLSSYSRQPLILSQDDAKEFLEKQRKRLSEPDSSQNRRRKMSSTPNDERSRFRTSEEDERRPNRPSATSARTRNDRRRAALQDKPIYDGRAQNRKKTKVPDPPSSSLWPDVDSFRRMLRDEAVLRLRVLGDGFSDVVKQESEWRLELYKSWLWAIHDGIGEPLVESRSERMRRRPGKVNSEVSQTPRRRRRD